MDKKKLKRWLVGDLSFKRLIRSCLEIYLCVLAYAYFFSDRMIFYPRHSGYADGSDILKIETADGDRISALYLPNTNAELTILHSHGNAEDLGDIRPVLEMFRDAGFAVFAYDYRGYGTSDGKASTRSAYRDAEAAYDYLINELHIPPERIIAHGRSVGAALALHLAYKKRVSGVILESAFVTAFRVKTVIPLAPFDKFRNIDLIRKIRQPILVIHGTADNMIPCWHGRKLYETASDPKLCLWVEGALHDDLIWVAGDRYWDAIRQLTKSVKRRTSSDI